MGKNKLVNTGVFQMSVGEKIELRLRLSDGSYASAPFPSQIQDVLSEKEFLIFPLADDDLDRWIGRVLQMMVIRKNETYIGAVKVEKKSSERALSFLHLVVLEDFERKQRRAFYRLKTELEIEIFDYGKFKTVDISGNGIAFISDRKIAENELIAGALDLQGNAVRVTGTVVRCIDIFDRKFLVCVTFTDIPKALQDQMMTFIHRQQLIMLKKGIRG